MMASVPTLLSASSQRLPNHLTTETGLFLDPRVREAIYEMMPPGGRPLSYPEMLRRWIRAVIKRQEVYRSMDDAQEEYLDSASDIIAVVGQEDYNKFLEILMAALERTGQTDDAGVGGREPVLN